MRLTGWSWSVLLLLTAAPAVGAHPVPKNTHDRTVEVQLARSPGGDQVTVRVKYRLEVDELTAFTRDLEPYADDIDALKFRGRPEALYGELARRLGPDLAFRLSAKANGSRLDFRCQEAATRATLHDEQGTPLGHLRCDFVFEANYAAEPGRENDLEFRDQTYLGEDGKLELSFSAGAGIRIVRAAAPDDALKGRPPLERQPGDDDRLRELRVVYRTDAAAVAPAVPPSPATPQAAAGHNEHSLVRLLLHTDYGFWLTMLMAAVFGAAHALTPGHGKTLVAAYLVGERGTSWHAVVLGIVTTLTHTGVVLLLALVLFCLPTDGRDAFGRLIHEGLGLAMGLVVVCLGFWLLLQRLSGRADHFHVVGGHHHHGPAEAVVATDDSSTLRWWSVIVLGITGGLVPCWDAIYLLLYTVGRSQFVIALPAVLAFSAGLAGVLVLIGVLVVQVPNFARSRWGNGRLVRALPIVSAVVVTLMGLWLCYEGVQGR